MTPIADSPWAHDVARWVAGGDDAAFTRALEAREAASWTGGHRIGIDESLATFDDSEWWIARQLVVQGHAVTALPTRHRVGLRAPDAVVSGLLVEFKTYSGSCPRQLLTKIGRARPQGNRVVVRLETEWDREMTRSIFDAAISSARRRGTRALMFLGDDLDLEWGEWNGRLATTLIGMPSCVA